MKAPKLRFKGFADNWETKKIKDIATVNQGLKISVNDRFFEKGENRFLYITNEFLKRSSKVKYYIDNPQKSVLCHEEDILMTRTGNTGQVVSNVSGAFHNNFFKINYNKSLISRDYLISFLKLKSTQKIIMAYAGQSTVPDLKHGDFYKIKISYPSLKEQEKIGKFINELERKIKLQQGKIELLREQKKGYMRKIFSQELRFRDDDGREFPGWDLRKLGDVIKVNLGRDYKHLNIGNIPVYGTGGYMLSVNEFLSDEDAIGIGRKGTINQPQKLFAPFWTVDTLFYCTPKKYNDFDFIYILFQYIKWEKYDESTGVPSLSKKTIENIVFPIPCYEEQRKTGSLFKKFNERILLESDKLVELQNQKQAYMQQMFI
ncbi:restriction endonuclease subunit S [Mesobacillus foraminis]|uniref:restriction endonuclease subunit S n=1 Tax=Mesobacillus foraminis TaxID=279826 RepID=UPI0039A241C9